MLLSVKMHKILLWQKAAQNATIPLGYIFFQITMSFQKLSNCQKITQTGHPENDQNSVIGISIGWDMTARDPVTVS